MQLDLNYFQFNGKLQINILQQLDNKNSDV